MSELNNGIIDPNNGGSTGNPQPKKGLKGFAEKVVRMYDNIRYSKGGKIAAKILTGLAIGGTAKACYDKGFKNGKNSVVPTVVTIERVPENEDTPAEAPAEETSAVEEV